MRVISTPAGRAILLWGGVLLLAIPFAAAPPTWYRFQSGMWELATDAGERRGEELLRRLVEAYAALRQTAPEMGPVPEAPPRAVRAMLFRSGRDFAPFRRGESHRGLYLSGFERDWILLPESGQEAARAAVHELVHLILRHSPAAAPQWLEEGLADYYSTMEISRDTVRLGKAPAAHARLLRGEPWMDAGRLMSMSLSGQAEPESWQVGLFYAQSWALVRWMMIGGGGAERVEALLTLLAEGRSKEAAFRDTYGVAAEEALERARRLLETLPPDAAPDVRRVAVSAPEAVFLREPLPPPVPDAWRAECLLEAGREREAERLAREMLRRNPSSAAAEMLLGALALRRSDPHAARGHLERAIASGGADARVHFEYAMLIRDTKGPGALVEQSLRQAVAAGPGFAEAWLVLGNWLMGEGRAAEAAPCLEKATVLDPRRSVAWEAWGRALLELGDKRKAREAAFRALLHAANSAQREMALALMREVEVRPAPLPKPGPPVQTPAGWQPREGDARAEGRLVWIGCEDARFLFRIEVKPAAANTAAVTVLLETASPNRILLRGKTQGRREFVCGEQKPAPPVAAGYIAAPAPAVAPSAAEPAQPQPPPAPAKKTASSKSAKKAPVKKPAAPPAPPKPKPEPAAGELVWLEFQ